jgi:hypothetical protein
VQVRTSGVNVSWLFKLSEVGTAGAVEREREGEREGERQKESQKQKVRNKVAYSIVAGRTVETGVV